MRFGVFSFQESPQYLLSKGRDAEAVKVLQKIAKANKRPCILTINTLEAISQESGITSPTTEDSGDLMLEPRGVGDAKTSVLKKARTELKRMGALFSTKYLARLTVLVWIIYAFDYWGFSIAGKHIRRWGNSILQTKTDRIFLANNPGS